MKRLISVTLMFIMLFCAFSYAEISANGIVPTKEDVTVLSVAPDGVTMLGVNKNDRLVCIRGGKSDVIKHDKKRGVEDAYGCVEMFMSMQRMFFNRDNVVWSSDSRYAVIVNSSMALMNMQFVCDPTVIDTKTGEYFIASTTPRKLGPQSGAMLAAVFSDDAKYLYYLQYGGDFGTNTKTSVIRYDMETGENKVIYALDDMYYGLYSLSDSTLFTLTDSPRANESQKLVTTMGISHYLPAWGHFSRPVYSDKTGLGLVLGTTGGIDAMSVLCKIDMSALRKVSDGVYALNAESGQMEYLRTKDELQQGVYALIAGIAMSPDGNRTFMTAYANGEAKAYVIDMDTMSAQEVIGMDKAALKECVIDAQRTALEWNPLGILFGNMRGTYMYGLK